MSVDDISTLRRRLMGHVKAMDASGNGIFNEEVTPMIAPYFRPGQSLKDAAAIVRDSGLGELEPFKGETSPGDGTLFVSKFSLIDQVFVVLDFAFRKASNETLVVDHVRAFLRSQSM